MRSRCLTCSSMVGVLGCGSRLHVGDQLGGGGRAGSGGGQAGSGGGQAGSSGGQAGAAAGAAGSIMPSGAGGTGGFRNDDRRGRPGGYRWHTGRQCAVGGSSSATFAGTLVETVSPSATFTVRNQGTASAGTTTALAALAAPTRPTSGSRRMAAERRCTGRELPARGGLRAEDAERGAERAPRGQWPRAGPPFRSAAPRCRRSACWRAPWVGRHADGRGRTRVSAFRKASPARGRQPLRGRQQHDPEDRHRDRGRHHLRGIPDLYTDGDGTGADARLNLPFGIAADGAGNLFVADTWNSTIRRVARDRRGHHARGGGDLAGNADGTGLGARFMPRLASPSTGPATSSSRTAATAQSGRSSSRPGTSRRSLAGAATAASTGLAPTPVSTDHSASPATEAEISTSPRPAATRSGRSSSQREPSPRSWAGPPASSDRTASRATGRATSTSPTTTNPQDRHRDESRHHRRGHGESAGQRGRNRRGRAFQSPDRRRPLMARATSMSPIRRTTPSERSSSRPGSSPRSRAWRCNPAPPTGRAPPLV